MPKLNRKNILILTKLLLAFLFSLLSLLTLPFPSTHAQQEPTAVIYVGSQQQVGYPVSIDGSQSTGRNPMGDDGDIFGIQTYTWNFGDGSPEESGEYLNTITHVYSSPRTYTINLRVTDYHGQSTTTSTSITAGTLPKVTVSGSNGSAISSAINSLGGQPGIVYLPAGDYSLTNSITIPSGVIIEGAGMTQTRLHNDSSGYMFTIGGDNARITNLELIGPDPANYYAVYSARKNFYFDHCDMHGFKYANAISGNGSATFEYNDIHNNPTEGYGYGIMVTGGAYIMVRHNEFSNNRHSITGNGQGNEVRNTGYDFIDNYIELDNNTAVGTTLDMHASGHGRIRICDNFIENVRYGIQLMDGWGEIRRNIFRNVSGYILRLGNPVRGSTWIDGAGVRNLYFDNNEFFNCRNRYWLQYGTDIYINCRKVDDLIPYDGPIDWNDCATPTPTPYQHCPPLGDIDCSGRVNGLDFGSLVAHWGTTNPKANLDDAGVVDATDALILLANYGKENP